MLLSTDQGEPKPLDFNVIGEPLNKLLFVVGNKLSREWPTQFECWRRGWDSNPAAPLNLRKLLILRSATFATTATTARVGYTLGTLALLAALLFAGVASAQAQNAPQQNPQPGGGQSVRIIQTSFDCPHATEIADLAFKLPFPASWKIYIVCDPLTWDTVQKNTHTWNTDTGFTNREKRMTIIYFL